MTLIIKTILGWRNISQRLMEDTTDSQQFIGQQNIALISILTVWSVGDYYNNLIILLFD